MALSTLESEGAKGAPHAAGGDALGVPDGAIPPPQVGAHPGSTGGAGGAGGGPTRQPPTSEQIDAVIAAAMANAPPAPPPMELGLETSTRSLTPLMTNILPSAIGSDGRVNLFVGNLPYRVRWQDLKDLFRKAGTVLRADVSLGPDNRSRGYGNVLMGSREDAARAIDRFNGFTWQTRTLEVRPDRLPPEYEPQPHVHHKPMYGFGAPPMQHFGGAGAWPHRPPHHGPPFGQFAPHLGPSHGGPGHFARNPHLAAGAVPVGASPLAGSLTAGSTQAVSAAPAAAGPSWGRDSLAPFASLNDPVLPARSASPLGRDRTRPASPAPPANDPLRSGPVPPVGRIPPAMLGGGVKSTFAPDLEPPVVVPHRPVSGASGTDAATVPLPPIALNGLASQAKDLGAPNTLVDRVVFVKNLSSTTQWQDLKDLFRPAGVVIRADVATGPDGQSRGFGTVLFASKEDALKSVNMFNGREVDGRVLHVQTERQTLEDKQIQPIHPVDPFPAFGTKPSPPIWSQSPLPSLATAGETQFPAPAPGVSPSATSPSQSGRVPWQLNTLVSDATTTPPRKETQPEETPPRQARHPGPIQLPPFPALGEINPMSPLQTRNLPPMTPSMPGFVFNAYPQTPPVHPQFLSPGGAGPFSPGLPVTSPLAGRRSPFLNAAPGAPVVQPPQGSSAALSTPTTQAFPNGARSLAGAPAPGAPPTTDEYFPPVGASPLNGRERLASTVDDLASGTASTTLDAPTASTSSSPSPAHKRGTSAEKLAPGTATAPAPIGTAPGATNGRSSFDGPRQNLGVWNSDRRASWSEVAGGAIGQGR